MYCFAKICRLCLSHDSVLIHCGARDKNGIPYYHKIKILLPQLVNKTSQHFPIWICTKCQEQVNQSYEFKQKCYKSYKLLKKYSLQLYEANKDKNIPDVPAEIFQEVKPIIDKNIISIDEEDHSENYYNADDITIVKNELLPTNFKNEPEFHNMIQKIIDNNFETIRLIDGSDNSAVTLKRELINKSEVIPSNTVDNEELVQDETQPVTSLVSENNNKSVQSSNIITCATDKISECVSTINSLDASAFTLDYTNASFETFASHVAPNINVTSESVPIPNVTNTNESTATNLTNSSTRVLRQRKSICYRTMEKCLDDSDNVPTAKRKKRTYSSTRSTYKTKCALKQLSVNEERKKANVSVSSNAQLNLRTEEKHQKKINSKVLKPVVTRNSELIERAIKEHKQKYGAYFCEKCSKQYVMYSKFRIHTSKCKGIIRPQCTVCQKFFASPANLRRHSKLHLIVQLKINCDLCQNQYSTKTALLNHIRARHNLNINKTNPFFKET